MKQKHSGSWGREEYVLVNTLKTLITEGKGGVSDKCTRIILKSRYHAQTTGLIRTIEMHSQCHTMRFDTLSILVKQSVTQNLLDQFHEESVYMGDLVSGVLARFD